MIVLETWWDFFFKYSFNPEKIEKTYFLPACLETPDKKRVAHLLVNIVLFCSH